MVNKVVWDGPRQGREVKSFMAGDCFTVDGNVYMMTNSGPNHADKVSCVIDVATGQLIWLSWSIIVMPINITINATHKP